MGSWKLMRVDCVGGLCCCCRCWAAVESSKTKRIRDDAAPKKGFIVAREMCLNSSILGVGLSSFSEKMARSATVASLDSTRLINQNKQTKNVKRSV